MRRTWDPPPLPCLVSICFGTSPHAAKGVSRDILRVLLRVQDYLRCPLGWDPVTCGRLAVILAGYKVLSAFPCLLAMAVQYRQACGKAFRGVTPRIFRFTIVVNRSSGRFEFPADLLSRLSHPTSHRWGHLLGHSRKYATD